MSKTSATASKVTGNVCKGAHRQRHERSDGWTIYWYAWRGGPQIGRYHAPTYEAAHALELEDAEGIAKRYLAERRPQAPDGTVARAVVAFMTSPLWAEYASKTKGSWGPWLEIVREKWGHLSGEEFSSEAMAEEIGGWIDEIAARSPSSAVKAKGAVSRFCSWARARSRKLLPRDCNPTDELETAYTRPVQLPPGRDAVEGAIKELPELASAICDIALNSGLRRSDLCLLSDPHIDESAGIVRLGTKKGKRRRRIAVLRLTPALLASIRRAQAIRDATYARKLERARKRGLPEPVKPLAVIVNTRCMAFTPDGLYQHVRSAFEEAKRDRINPHGFRRASATQRYISGLSWAQIGRELGWGEKEAETMGAIYVQEEAAVVYNRETGQ